MTQASHPPEEVSVGAPPKSEMKATARPPKKSEAGAPSTINEMLNDGYAGSSHLSRHRAGSLLEDFKKCVNAALFAEADLERDRAAKEFLAQAVLGAGWYRSRCRGSQRWMWAYIALNTTLVIAVPVLVAWLPKMLGLDENGLSAFTSQATAILTGVFALQKTLSAWWAARQRYGAWAKAAADLKKLYFGLVGYWDDDELPGSKRDFTAALQVAAMQARAILDAEELDYYQTLALPSFDVLDMLTASRGQVQNLVMATVPSAAPRGGSVIGTKVIPAPLDPVEDTATEPAPPEGSLLRTVAFQEATAAGRLSQAAVTACADFSVATSADLASAFRADGGFHAWFNQHLAADPAIVAAGRGRIADDAESIRKFNLFWDQATVLFGNSANGVQFCALMGIILLETGGRFEERPEGMGAPGHRGLSYAFDTFQLLDPKTGKVRFRKQTYNRADNHTVKQLLEDPTDLFLHAHRHRAQTVPLRNGRVDPRWGLAAWPDPWPRDAKEEINGQLMQADFYKFRGRGVIQTTWRPAYEAILDFMLSHPSVTADGELRTLVEAMKAKAAALGVDATAANLATLSGNEDWKVAFSNPIILGNAVRLHSEDHGDYLQLSAEAAVLDSDLKTKGSLQRMIHRINQGAEHAANGPPIMRALINALAAELGEPGDRRWT